MIIRLMATSGNPLGHWLKSYLEDLIGHLLKGLLENLTGHWLEGLLGELKKVFSLRAT